MLPIQDEYHLYLKFEKALSNNTIEAYESDLLKLSGYLSEAHLTLETAKREHLRDFLIEISSLGIHPRSQARILSSIKSFYHFLIYKNHSTEDPTELLESPRIGLRLPEVLSLEEIDAIVGAVDLSKPEGQRNKAIIEVLYGSGLRVSELIGLQLSKLYMAEGYMLVEGKGSKQRLVPMSTQSIKQIELWKTDRNLLTIKKRARRQPVFEPERFETDTGNDFYDSKGISFAGRHTKKCEPAYIQAFVCHPPVGKRSQPEGNTTTAGS